MERSLNTCLVLFLLIIVISGFFMLPLWNDKEQANIDDKTNTVVIPICTNSNNESDSAWTVVAVQNLKPLCTYLEPAVQEAARRKDYDSAALISLIQSIIAEGKSDEYAKGLSKAMMVMREVEKDNK